MHLADAAFEALGDPTRRKVFSRLRRGPQSVAVLARGLEVSRPAVSQHLRVLREARLVTVRVEGARRVYAIDPRGLEAVRTWIDGFWDEALDRFKTLAESEANREDER